MTMSVFINWEYNNINTIFYKMLRGKKSSIHRWYQPSAWTGGRRSRWCRREPRGVGAGGSDPAGGQTRLAGRLSSGALTADPPPSEPTSSARPAGSTAPTLPAADRRSPARAPARSPSTPAPCPAGTAKRHGRGRRGCAWPETGSDV